LPTPVHAGNNRALLSLVVFIEKQYVGSRSRMKKNRWRRMKTKCIMVEVPVWAIASDASEV